MIQLVTLEINTRTTEFLSQTFGEVKRTWATDVMLCKKVEI
jgi:hypothetical protein